MNVPQFTWIIFTALQPQPISSRFTNKLWQRSKNFNLEYVETFTLNGHVFSDSYNFFQFNSNLHVFLLFHTFNGLKLDKSFSHWTENFDIDISCNRHIKKSLFKDWVKYPKTLEIWKCLFLAYTILSLVTYFYSYLVHTHILIPENHSKNQNPNTLLWFHHHKLSSIYPEFILFLTSVLYRFITQSLNTP